MSCRQRCFPWEENVLSKLVKSALTAAVALTLPLDALAGSSDADYCASLSELYVKYAYGVLQHAPIMDMSGRMAMSQCASGDTSSGIPVLGGKLRNNKISLPKR
jgi:hypothetical protein